MDIAKAEALALTRLEKLLESADERIALKAATEILRHIAARQRRADQHERAQKRAPTPPRTPPAQTPHAPAAPRPEPHPAPHQLTPVPRPSQALTLATKAGAP